MGIGHGNGNGNKTRDWHQEYKRDLRPVLHTKVDNVVYIKDNISKLN